MNTGYGKLAGGEVEYAPDAITKDDGSVVSNPSAATCLAAGWKHIVDEPPAAEPGKTVCVSGWDEGKTTITRLYKQVDIEPTPETARVFSKLKLVAALKEADKWVLVKTWIEEKGYWDYYLAAQNFREDNPLFVEALASLKEYARFTDGEVETILSACIWEND